MSFDINNPADLLALKTEVNTDPSSVGYDPTGPTEEVLALLNLAANNPGSEKGTPPLLLGDLWQIIVEDGATATQAEFELGLLYAMGEGPDTDVSRWRETIKTVDTGIGNRITALARDLSRAEALFAVLDATGTTEYVVISREDWLASRDS